MWNGTVHRDGDGLGDVTDSAGFNSAWAPGDDVLPVQAPRLKSLMVKRRPEDMQSLGDIVLADDCLGEAGANVGFSVSEGGARVNSGFNISFTWLAIGGVLIYLIFFKKGKAAF